MPRKIIPFGYASGGMALLERLMGDETTYLVDIRLSPRSGWQVFNKEALKTRFHSQYIHLPELGNINYRNGQPIQIAHPDHGIPRLIRGLNQGYTLLLMCGCKEYGSCHRRTVVNLLIGAMPGVQVDMPDGAGKS